MSDTRNQRILLIDDNPAIHADFKKILNGGSGAGADFDSLAEGFFGSDAPPAPAQTGPAGQYELDSALQGQEALEKVRAARAAGRPYALTFCDVRMPPGWDGVETLSRLWAEEPDLQAVICTAFSDYSYSETVAKLGAGDRLLILKKPFDPIEAQQLAAALTEKWNVTRQERRRLEEVRRAEQEARAYASSLEIANHAIAADKAMAEAYLQARNDLILRASRSLQVPAASIQGALGAFAVAARRGAEPDAALESALSTIEVDCASISDTLECLEELANLDAGTPQSGGALCEPLLLARQVAENCRVLARRVHGTIEIDISEWPAGPLEIEARHLRLMLTALARAALARAGRTPVKLSMRTRGGSLQFEAFAPGARIGSDDLASLFEPFAREESLRLLVARRLARLTGGELDVEASEQGVRFALRLERSARGRQRAA